MKYIENNFEEIDSKYLETMQSYLDFIDSVSKFEQVLKSEKAKNFCRYGICRKIVHIRFCLNRFYNIFILESEGNPIPSETRLEQTAFLNYFLISVSGGIDNLALIFAYENNWEFPPSNISVLRSNFRQKLPGELISILNKYDDWLKKYLKDYRDAAAHRIAPYVLPYLQNEKTGEKVYDSCFVHDFNEAIHVQFHPQMLVDAITFKDIIEVGIKSFNHP